MSDSATDSTMEWSVFTSVNNLAAQRMRTTWPELCRHVKQAPAYPSKADCRLLKLATFNGPRCNDSMAAISGIEGDYDSEQVTQAQAIAMLEAAGVKAVVYASPSASETAHRWRVLAPTSKPYPPEARAGLVARLNGVLGGILAGESFTDSQVHYIGRTPVNSEVFAPAVTFNNPEAGQFLDLLPELEAGAVGKVKKPGKPAPPARTEASASHAPQLPEVWTSEETLRDLRSALASMRSDDRAIWIDMGHALKTLGDRGRGLWVEWGQGSEKWKPEDARLWDGFNPTQTSHKAVFKRAEQFGWVNPARRVQSPPEVDFAGLLNRDAGQVDPDTGEILSAPFTPPPPVPAGAGFDAIGYPPGLAGDVARYIFQSARMPIHSFAVAGALTTIAHLNANGAWVGLSDTGLNTYTCLTGKSGAGKDGPRNAIKRLVGEVAKRAPLQPALMCSVTEGYSSGPALLRALSADRQGLMMTDEFGMFLQSATAEGNSHLKDLVREMMALWGSSRSFHAGKRYADSKFNLEPVHCPYLNVLGTTTPVELAAAITAKQVDNGFLNRILFIPASEVNPVNHAPDTRIAPALVARLVELTERPAGPIEYDSEGTWRAMIQAGEQLTEPGEFEALWTRAPEMCIRLAGLLALGDGGRITSGHVRWAASYVRWSIKGFAVFLGDDMAETDFQRSVSRARHIIRNAREYVTDKQFGAWCKKGILPRGKLTKLMKVPSRELDDVVRHLVESGQVAQVEGGLCALA